MLSQTIEYALRAMMHLAALAPGESASSEVISTHTQTPAGYLSKVMRDLVLAELVVSQRGPKGGFALARTPDKISMLDVVNAVDSMQRIHRCPLGNPAHLKLCPLHQRIDSALDHIEGEFRRTTLAEMLVSGKAAADRCGALVTPTVRKKKAKS